MRKTIGPILLVLATLLTPGCGDGGAAVLKRRSNLHELGLAYRDFVQANQRSAAGIIELTEYMKSQSADTPEVRDAIAALQEGDIVLIWNGVLEDTEQVGQHILGFEAGVPSTGGYVVMSDGIVRLMTAKEYSEATMLPAVTK